MAVLLAACGSTRATQPRPAVRIKAPSPAVRGAAIETLQPPPTPSPTPTPGPPTPPRPTPTPLEPPRGAEIRAASGTQKGAFNSHCWLYGNGRSDCRDYPVPSQPSGLRVTKGETVTLLIDAPIRPTDMKIRPFQGTRTDYPQRQLDPALETGLQIDLEPPGNWDVDLCATWRGHGEAVCWLFRLEVSGS